jgi:lauroyl/myristoyl acyltransferase
MRTLSPTAVILVAIVLILVVMILCVVAWHWDAKRVARRSSGPGLPRTLAEHQRRQTVVLQTVHPATREVVAEVKYELDRADVLKRRGQ